MWDGSMPFQYLHGCSDRIGLREDAWERSQDDRSRSERLGF